MQQNAKKILCSKDIISETKGSFRVPVLKRPTATRTRRYEKFLWKELYDEYIRHYQREEDVVLEKPQTEYFDQYCKHMPIEIQETKEELRNEYPLYCSTAITLWNREGDVTKDFKKHYSITRPMHERTEQFG